MRLNLISNRTHKLHLWNWQNVNCKLQQMYFKEYLNTCVPVTLPHCSLIATKYHMLIKSSQNLTASLNTQSLTLTAKKMKLIYKFNNADDNA